MSNHQCGCGNHEEEEVKDQCCQSEECTDETCCSDDDCDCGDDCDCDEACDSDSCGCGHDHDMQTITLQTEEGEDLNCLVIGTFEVEGKGYIALLPEGEEDVFIYGYKQEGEHMELDRIETDEEYHRVGEVFMKMWGEDEEEAE